MKMSGLIVSLLLSSLLAAALIGAASASGTALCEEAPVENQCGPAYAKEAAFAGTASNAVLEAGKVVDKCGKSTIEGKLSEGSTGEGKALKASITSMTFAGCGCTTTEALHLPYNASLSWTSAANGKMTLESSGKGSPAIKTTCSGLSCAYSATAPSVEVIGGEPAKIEFKVTLTANEEEAGCKVEKALYTASYSLTQPNSGKAFVANNRALVKLCAEWNGLNTCPGGMTYNIGEEIKAEQSANVALTFKVSGALKNPTCTASILKGTVSAIAWPAIVTVNELTLTNCAGNVCAVTAEHLPYRTKIDAYANPFTGSGPFTMESNGSGPPEIKIACGGFTCVYSEGTMSAQVIAGTPAMLGMVTNLTTVGGAGCEAPLLIQAGYTFIKPEPGGVRKMWIVREAQ